MSWFKTHLKNSMHAIISWRHSLGLGEEQASQIGIDEIRDSMLALLEDVADDKRLRTLTRRISYAMDAQALWYLRGDLMAVLAGRYGEAAAREQLDAITRMFQDILPRGLKSRPSPLNVISRD